MDRKTYFKKYDIVIYAALAAMVWYSDFYDFAVIAAFVIANSIAYIRYMVKWNIVREKNWILKIRKGGNDGSV